VQQQAAALLRIKPGEHHQARPHARLAQTSVTTPANQAVLFRQLVLLKSPTGRAPGPRQALRRLGFVLPLLALLLYLG
jgi:hypothetical protein